MKTLLPFIVEVEDHITRLRQIDHRLELFAKRIRRCTSWAELFRGLPRFTDTGSNTSYLAVVVGLPQAVELILPSGCLVEPLVVLTFRGVTRAGQRLQYLEVFAVGAALYAEIVVVDLAHRFQRTSTLSPADSAEKADNLDRQGVVRGRRPERELPELRYSRRRHHRTRGRVAGDPAVALVAPHRAGAVPARDTQLAKEPIRHNWWYSSSA